MPKKEQESKAIKEIKARAQREKAKARARREKESKQGRKKW